LKIQIIFFILFVAFAACHRSVSYEGSLFQTQLAEIRNLEDPYPDSALRRYNAVLQSVAATGDDSLHAEVLYRMALTLKWSGNPDSATVYFNRIIRQAAENDANHHVGDAYLELGQYYNNKGFFTIARSFFKNIYEQENMNPELQASALAGYANSLDAEGDYSQAIEYYQKSIGFFSRLNNKKRMAQQLMNLASALAEAGQLAESDRYYQRAVNEFQTLGDSSFLGSCFANMAINFKNSGNDSALYYYDKAISYHSQMKDSMSLIIAIYNKALYLKNTKPDETLGMLNLVMDYSLRNGLIQGQIMSYNAFSDYYNIIGKKQEALNSARFAVELANKNGLNQLELQALKTYSKCLEVQGDYNGQSKALMRMMELSEQLNRSRNTKAAVELRQLFEVAELEREKQNIQHEALRQKTINRQIMLTAFFLLAISTVLIVSIIFLFRLYRSRDKAYHALMNIYQRQKNTVAVSYSVTDKPENNLQQENDTIMPDVKLIKQKVEHLINHEKIFTDGALSADTFAAKAGLTRKQLSNYLQQMGKSSFTQFINELRVNYARELLEETGTEPVKMDFLANKAGYNSRQVFYKAFISITGMPPGLYRDRISQEK